MSAESQGPGGKTERGLFLAGNWKMYKTPDEARALAAAIAKGAPKDPKRQVAIFPPTISVATVAETVQGSNPEVIVGAQNMHFEKEGAFTGEVSAEMVLASGGKAVILGHSERRHVFGESDEFIAKKVHRALEVGLTPILCVGEKLDEREAGVSAKVVARQLNAVLPDVENADKLGKIIIAYEPVWAIGTGKTASPEQGQEIHRVIRDEVGKVYASKGASESLADGCLILYGGSVKPDNAAELLAAPDIDGVLVGGASLKADSFLAICSAGL